MKYLIKSAVLALLLASTEAIKLSKNESSDIDADDADIQEGPLKNDTDALIF
jgi:predicted lipid-binding transport protein (Tim44 family)